ncbi:MAG: hypothetical protein ACOZF2_11160 [Thermodesulfobacteriota bacterium]
MKRAPRIFLIAVTWLLLLVPSAGGQSSETAVPISQARSLGEALKKQKKTWEYLEVPTGKIGGHFIILTKPEIWEQIDSFLKKNL